MDNMLIMKQGPHKLSSLKSTDTGHFSEKASLSNSGWRNCKERHNRFTNNGDMADLA